MKIFFLIRSLELGGSEKQLLIMAKGLQQLNHSVCVAVFYSGGSLEGDYRDAGITVHLLGKRCRWDVVTFLARLIRLIKLEKPDILHGYLGVSNLITVLMKPFYRGMKVVWGVRSSYIDYSRYDWLSRVSFKIENILSGFADLILVNSTVGRNYHTAKGFCADNMLVIHNGIDTDSFRRDLSARDKIRSEWNIKEEEKLIGLVGRLDPMKDHETFLKAASILSRQLSNVCFVCVGDGPSEYKKQLHEISNKLELTQNIIWTGARHDMPAVQNALDIATSSSYGEGFPNSIAEAMACEVPCVVTDAGDLPSIVGETGVVVQPKDPQALADGWKVMLEYSSGDLRSIGKKARERILEQFGLEKSVKKTLLAFEGLL